MIIKNNNIIVLIKLKFKIFRLNKLLIKNKILLLLDKILILNNLHNKFKFKILKVMMIKMFLNLL